MATETNQDIYKFESAEAENNMKRLVEVAKDFATSLQVQIIASQDAAASLGRLEKSGQENVKAMRENASAIRGAAKATKDMHDEVKTLGGVFKEELERKLVGAAAQFRMLEEVVRKTVEVMKQSVEQALEAEEAELRLDSAIRRAGYGRTGLNDALKLQAEGLRTLTGVDEANIQALQEQLVSFEVAPAKVGALTQAIMDYSAFTRKDLNTATREVIGAIRGESETLGKLKLDLSNTGTEAERMDAVIREVSSYMGGESKNLLDGHAGAVRRAGSDWNALKEKLGSAALAWYDIARSLPTPTAGLIRIGEAALNSTHNVEALAEGLEKAQRIASNKDPGGMTFKESEGETFDDKQYKDRLAKARQFNKELKELTDVVAKDYQHQYEKRVENQEKLQEEIDHFDKEWKKKQQDFEIDQFSKKMQNYIKDEEDKYKAQQDYNKLCLEADERKYKAQIEMAQNFAEEQVSIIRGYAEQLVSYQVGTWINQATANKEYTDKFTALSIERRQAELKEQGIIKDYTIIQSELQAEEENANRARVADMWRTIASQSAVKALFEAAEAIASLASWNYEGAALHGGAAVAFAAIAGVGTNIAASLNKGRGLTSQERAELEGMQRDINAKNRDKKEAAAIMAGPSVNVYNFGISGLTETEQMASLEAQRRKYSQLKTGSGG